MPINIVLEINSSSPANGREGTSDLKNLSEFYQMSWLSTLKFKDVLTENKKKKTFMWQWRNSKEKERLKENGGQMKRQVEVIW